MRDKLKQDTAYMTISNLGNNPNDIINSSRGIVYDFSQLKVGDTFRTNLHNPGPGQISLEWKDGDEVVLKEYDSDGNPELPPITEYRIKGTISNWSGNSFATYNPTINTNDDFAKGTVGFGPNKWILT